MPTGATTPTTKTRLLGGPRDTLGQHAVLGDFGKLGNVYGPQGGVSGSPLDGTQLLEAPDDRVATQNILVGFTGFEGGGDASGGGPGAGAGTGDTGATGVGDTGTGDGASGAAGGGDGGAAGAGDGGGDGSSM